MAAASLTVTARTEIRAIHKLSQRLNAARGKAHTDVLLELVREHAAEITELFSKNNSHYVVETGDLLILCLEILIEAGEDADEILATCYGRYHKKLNRLLAEQTGPASREGENA